MQEQIRPSYYAVIPANIRYDTEIPDGAKLLYGEITALCDKEGYCWASNSYFSGLYGKSTDTISRWISALARRGYIYTLVDNAAGNSRKIWLKESVEFNKKQADPIRKNADRVSAKMPKPSPQKYGDPHRKNAEHNNTVSITINGGEGAAPAHELQNHSLEEGKCPPPFPATPPQEFGYNDRPRAETPTELQAALSAFYDAHPAEWQAHLETFAREAMRVWGRRPDAGDQQRALEGYCTFAVETGKTNYTYQAQNARLRRWFADQPTMQKPAQQPQQQAAKEQAAGPIYKRFD